MEQTENFSVPSVWGPQFWGTLCSAFLLGVMVLQTLQYFITYKSDKWWIKLMVSFVLLCDLVDTFVLSEYAYNRLVINFGHEAALEVVGWEHVTHLVMMAMVAAVVQVFYAWRLLVLTKSWKIASIIIIGSVATWCGCIGTAIAVGIVKWVLDFLKFKSISVVWCVFGALTDTFIAIMMTWTLHKHKTGVQKTDSLIDRIMRGSVQTGSATAICAIFGVITYLVLPTSTVYLFSFSILQKLYTNTLMSGLNARVLRKEELPMVYLDPSGQVKHTSESCSDHTVVDTSRTAHLVLVNVDRIECVM